jgi:hypothetical protein
LQKEKEKLKEQLKNALNKNSKKEIQPLKEFENMDNLVWKDIELIMGRRYENEIHIYARKTILKCTYKELRFKSPKNKAIELVKLFCEYPEGLSDKFIKSQLNIKSKTSRKTINDWGRHFRKLFCIEDNPYTVERIKIPKTAKYEVRYIPSITFRFDKKIREYNDRKPSHVKYKDELITNPKNYLNEKESDAEKMFKHFTDGDEI